MDISEATQFDNDELTKIINEIEVVEKILKSYRNVTVDIHYNFFNKKEIKNGDERDYFQSNPHILNSIVHNLYSDFPIFISKEINNLKSDLLRILEKTRVSLAYFLISKIDSMRGDYTVKNINTAILLNKNIGKYYIERANLLVIANENDLAIDDYNTAIVLHSDKLKVLQRLINLYKITGNQKKLFECHNKRLKMMTDEIANFKEKDDWLKLQSLKQEICLSYMGMAYDNLYFKNLENVTIALKEVVKMGYVLKKEDKKAFKKLNY